MRRKHKRSPVEKLSPQQLKELKNQPAIPLQRLIEVCEQIEALLGKPPINDADTISICPP